MDFIILQFHEIINFIVAKKKKDIDWNSALCGDLHKAMFDVICLFVCFLVVGGLSKLIEKLQSNLHTIWLFKQSGMFSILK